MNKTDIEWCDYTFNPVTGCLHGCEYCYARGFAHRFRDRDANANYIRDKNGNYDELCVSADGKPFPADFTPTFYENRLPEPTKMKKPQRIFVVSMGDLFGDWVPDEWIQKVFEACEAAPWHKYLFLTKNPLRWKDLERKGIVSEADNLWYGVTVTHSRRGDARGMGNYYWPDFERNVFVSFEPLLEDLRVGGIGNAKWVIIGAESGNRKDKVIPKREWVEDIVKQCHSLGASVFMKNSLAGIWGEPLIQEWPEGLR